MRKKTIFLIGCAALTGIGVLLAAIGAALGGAIQGIHLNASGFHVTADALMQGSGADEYGCIKKQEELEAFENIDIAMNYADVNIEASDSGKYAVSYCIGKDMDVTCEVRDKTLVIEEQHSKMFHGITWFSFGVYSTVSRNDHFVTVYVPQDAALSDVAVGTGSGDFACKQLRVGDLKVKSEYGNIKMQDISSGNIQADLSSGDLMMQRVQGDNCKITNEYGGITMDSVTLAGDMEVDVDSGDIKWQDVTMRDLYLDSEYGKVDGQHVVFRNVEAKMSSGDCKLVDAAFDNWKMESEYGNVELGMARPLTDYRYMLKTEYGKVTLDGENMGESYRSILQDKEKEKLIEIDCDSGNIDIR